MKSLAIVLALLTAPCLAQQTRPATAPVAARVIAELKAENARLNKEVARLQKELDGLRELIAKRDPPAGPDIRQGMSKAAAEKTLKANGWQLQTERKREASIETLQTWAKEAGEFTLYRHITYGPNITIESWEESKRRTN